MRVTSGTVRPARTVLVTGGAGFIGRSLCAALVARGDHVHLVDVLPGARQRCAVTALPAVEVTAADLATAGLRELLHGVDVVVHLAARPGVQPSWGSGFEHYLRDNAVAHGAVTEDAPLRPLSPYGVSKVAAEMLVHTYVARGVDADVLRYFSVYGRHQRPDMAVAPSSPKCPGRRASQCPSPTCRRPPGIRPGPRLIVGAPRSCSVGRP